MAYEWNMSFGWSKASCKKEIMQLEQALAPTLLMSNGDTINSCCSATKVEILFHFRPFSRDSWYIADMALLSGFSPTWRYSIGTSCFLADNEWEMDFPPASRTISRRYLKLTTNLLIVSIGISSHKCWICSCSRALLPASSRQLSIFHVGQYNGLEIRIIGWPPMQHPCFIKDEINNIFYCVASSSILLKYIISSS